MKTSIYVAIIAGGAEIRSAVTSALVSMYISKRHEKSMTKEKYISYLTVKIGATEKQKARIETECDKLNVGSGSIIEQ